RFKQWRSLLILGDEKAQRKESHHVVRILDSQDGAQLQGVAHHLEKPGFIERRRFNRIAPLKSPQIRSLLVRVIGLYRPRHVLFTHRPTPRVTGAGNSLADVSSSSCTTRLALSHSIVSSSESSVRKIHRQNS